MKLFGGGSVINGAYPVSFLFFLSIPGKPRTACLHCYALGWEPAATPPHLSASRDGGSRPAPGSWKLQLQPWMSGHSSPVLAEQQLYDGLFVVQSPHLTRHHATLQQKLNNTIALHCTATEPLLHYIVHYTASVKEYWL